MLLPGVQVLFAFLLSLPFLSAFSQVTTFQRIVYFISFLATTGSMALLIVTPAYHRLRFKEGHKGSIIHTGSSTAVLALALLGIAVVNVVYLVTAFLFGGVLGAIIATGLAVLLFVLWYLLPKYRHATDRDPGE